MSASDFYIIREFNPATALAVIEWTPSGQRSYLTLPVDQNGEIPTGSKLDDFLRGLQPPAPRTLSISNVDAIMAIVQPVEPEAVTWDHVRNHRLQLLIDSDWTQLADADLKPEEVEAWRKYRQDLRDITDKATDPKKVKWPTPPGGVA